jgi:signal peptidase II
MSQTGQRTSRYTFPLLPLLCGILADQVTKGIARHYLTDIPAVHLLQGLIQLSYIENHNGFLGYLTVIPEPYRFLLLTAGVSIILCAAAMYLIKSLYLSRKQRVASSFILAGGSANLVDRILNDGGVIDFMSIGFTFFRTGIFNLADILILSGSFYLGYSFTQKNHLPAEKQPE